MKNQTHFIVLFALLFSCQERNLPDHLSVMQEGLLVNHNKRDVYAEYNLDDPAERGKYSWKFETTVSTEHIGLTVVEFGAYLWRNQSWEFGTIYNRPFNSDEFSRWYNCPKAELEPGIQYTDPNNWSKGDFLNGENVRTLWYYIAEDKNGVRFFGAEEINTVGSFKEY